MEKATFYLYKNTTLLNSLKFKKIPNLIFFNVDLSSQGSLKDQNDILALSSDFIKIIKNKEVFKDISALAYEIDSKKVLISVTHENSTHYFTGASEEDGKAFVGNYFTSAGLWYSPENKKALAQGGSDIIYHKAGLKSPNSIFPENQFITNYFYLPQDKFQIKPAPELKFGSALEYFYKDASADLKLLLASKFYTAHENKKLADYIQIEPENPENLNYFPLMDSDSQELPKTLQEVKFNDKSLAPLLKQTELEFNTIEEKYNLYALQRDIILRAKALAAIKATGLASTTALLNSSKTELLGIYVNPAKETVCAEFVSGIF